MKTRLIKGIFATLFGFCSLMFVMVLEADEPTTIEIQYASDSLQTETETINVQVSNQNGWNNFTTQIHGTNLPEGAKNTIIDDAAKAVEGGNNYNSGEVNLRGDGGWYQITVNSNGTPASGITGEGGGQGFVDWFRDTIKNIVEKFSGSENESGYFSIEGGDGNNGGVGGDGDSTLGGESYTPTEYTGPNLTSQLSLETQRHFFPLDKEEWVCFDGFTRGGRDQWLFDYNVLDQHNLKRRTCYPRISGTGTLAASMLSIISPPKNPWLNNGITCALDNCQVVLGYVWITPGGRVPGMNATHMGYKWSSRLEVEIGLTCLYNGQCIAQRLCPECRTPKKNVASRRTFLISVALGSEAEGQTKEAIANLEEMVRSLVAQFPTNTEWAGRAALPKVYAQRAWQDGLTINMVIVNETGQAFTAEPKFFSKYQSSLGVFVDREKHEDLITIPPGTTLFTWPWPEAEINEEPYWSDARLVVYVQNWSQFAQGFANFEDALGSHGNRPAAYYQRDIFCFANVELWMFHDVVDWKKQKRDCRNEKCFRDEAEYYYVSEEWFEKALQEAVTLRSQGRNIVFSFDDGSSRWLTHVLPKLEEHGVPGTFNVDTTRVTPEFLQALSSSPLVNVQTHSNGHVNLTKLSDQEVRDNLTLSLDIIETAIGKRPTELSLPFGAGGTGAELERIKKLALQVGIIRIRTSEIGSSEGPIMNVAGIATARGWVR